MGLQPGCHGLLVVGPQRKIIVRDEHDRYLRLEQPHELHVFQIMLLQPDREPGRVLGQHDIVEKISALASPSFPVTHRVEAGTLTAVTTILCRDVVGVLSSVLVSLRTVRFVPIPNWAAVQVLFSGYSLKMVWIDAARNPAKVIKLKTFGYGAFSPFI